MGIQLTEGLNASQLDLGQRLYVSVSIKNTLPRVNDLNASHSYGFVGAMIDFTVPDCFYYQPAMLMIAPGDYTEGNLGNASIQFEACDGAFDAQHVVFQPMSDQANVTGVDKFANAQQNRGPFSLNLNLTTPGYLRYDRSEAGLFSASLVESVLPFSAGVYTVAVGDEWGDVVILHVTVHPGVVRGPAFVSWNQSNGLNLSLGIQPSSSSNFTVTVKDTNALNMVNNLSDANDWPSFVADGHSIEGSEVLNPLATCGPTEPVGFAIFRGYYDGGDFWSGNQLTLDQPRALLCTTTAGAPPPTDRFQPMSDNMSVYVKGQFYYHDRASLTLKISGYWTGGFSDPVFNKFSPGIYTVVAGDKWGAWTLLYLLVSDSGAISAGSSIVPV